MNLLESLGSKREFRVFVPDITMQEAMKNDPYVLRIVLPNFSEFLEVIQIQDPFAGLSALGTGNAPQTAYAFLVDPDVPTTRNFYLTAVFPHQPFPWPVVTRGARQLLSNDTPVNCFTLGITTHSGVPILHVQTRVHHHDYTQFEQELKEFGYRIVEAKPYTKSEALVNLYKASIDKVRDAAGGKESTDGAKE